MRKKSYNVFIAWILAICMIFTGVGLYDTTSYAAGGVTPGDEEYTITFDYGILEEYLANNDYTYKGVTYAKSVTVKEGQTLEDIEDLVIPSYGDELNKRDFGYWMDQDDSYYYPYYGIYSDMTLTAHYEHHITYHAGEGKFHESSSDTYTRGYLSESEGKVDLSVVCYPKSNYRAFVGWSLKKDGTEDDLFDDSNYVYQNIDLYPVFVDGYPVTIDANIDGGYIYYYYESYKDSEGYNIYGSSRYFGPGNKTVTFTYPVGVKPSDANYFCSNPIRYNSCMNPGDNDVEFKELSLDKSGAEGNSLYFYNYEPKGDGTDTIYAIWSEYWVVKFNSNRGNGNDYDEERRVVKGESVFDIPYSYFRYYTDDATRECIEFNTKQDGSGTKIDSSFVPTSNITVYAQYKDTYQISFDGNGGSIYSWGSSFTVDKGEEVKGTYDNMIVIWPEEEDGTVSRKVLKNWNTAADGSGETPPFTPTKNTTLYAQPENGVLITYDTNAQDGDEGNQYGTLFSFRGQSNKTEATYAYSKNKPMTDVPYLSYYVNETNKQFAGWSPVYGDTSSVIDPSKFVPTKDMTLYATWYNLIDVTYDGNGGKFAYGYDDEDNTHYTTKVLEGKKYDPYSAEVPEADGQVFVGWSEKKGSNKIIPYGKTFVLTEPMEFYAVWESGNTITLDGNGGNVIYISSGGHEHHGDTSKAVFTIAKGETVLTANTYKDESFDSYTARFVEGWHEDGLVLGGWTKTLGGEQVDLTTYVPTGDETFYASWEEPCTVTFDPNGGTIESYYTTIDVRKGSTLYSLPTPKKDGEYFVKWVTEDGKDLTTETIINSDMTVKAVWTTEKVTVSFDCGENATLWNGDEYVNNLQIEIGKGSSLNFSNYIPYDRNDSGLNFGGWKSDSYTWNSDKKNSYYTVNEDMQFTAIWEAITYYDVIFDGNGGLVESSMDGLDPAEEIEIKVEKGYTVGGSFYAYLPDEPDKEFTGWYSDKECTNLVATAKKISSYKPTASIRLYAGYEEKKVNVTGVTLSKTKISLGVSGDEADTYKLSAVIYPSNATNDNVTYTSSDESVVTVDSKSGLVTAVGEGEAVITVTTEDGGFTATCSVTVTSVTATEAKDKLENLKNAIATATADEAKDLIKKTVDEIGGVERIAGLIDQDDTMYDLIDDLEGAYITAAGITVENPADSDSNCDVLAGVLGVTKEDILGSFGVSGAGLSALPGDTVSLQVSEVSDADKKDIDSKYTNAAQFDMELVKSDGTEIEELEVPVTVKLPIPTGRISSKMYILHFNDDGTYEVIRPVFKHNSMYVTVTHFSIFAIVETSDGEIIDPGNVDPTPGPTAAPTSNPGSAATPTPVPKATTQPQTTVTAKKAAAVGTAIKDTASNANYKVTSDADPFTVAYVKPNSKSIKKALIPDTITADGVTYKVTSIAAKAFMNCKKLKTVNVKATGIVKVGANAFKGIHKKAVIKVPKSKLKDYKKKFAKKGQKKTVKIK